MARDIPEPRVSRLERLTNLVLYLLHAPRPVTIHEISDQVAGYSSGGDPATIRQQFERDKRLLREQGIVIQVEPVRQETQLGYSIREQDFFLPDLGLTGEEQSALSIAVAAVHSEDSTSRVALAKLGIAPSDGAFFTATLPESPRLSQIHQAICTRSPASFSYRGAERTVDPFGLLCRNGAWYLFGWDHLRSERRTYRVDRIEGELTMGEPGTFQIPADFEVSRALPARAWEIGEGDRFLARVLIEGEIAPIVVASVGEDRVEERHDNGAVTIVLKAVNSEALLSWILGMADHATVLDPPELVREVVDRLDRMAAAFPVSGR